MMTSSSTLLLGVGVGVGAQLILFILLNKVFRLNGRSAAAVVAMLVMLVFVPWAILTWPGADVFAIQLAILLTVAYVLGALGDKVGRRWHWVPAAIVGFFVVVVVMNIIFLGVAEQGITGLFARLLPEPHNAEVVDSRFPGTVSHDFQEKEALYNAYLRQVEAQHQRGWQVRKGWELVPVAGQSATFIVAVTDRDGAPVSGADVSGRFLRSSNSRADIDFAMREVAPGEYRVELAMPLQGLWQLVLQVRRGDDVHEVRADTAVESRVGQAS